jgi:hypothetical protein
MSDCHNDNFAWSQATHDLVGEPINDHAAGVAIPGNRRSDFWAGLDEGERCNDRIEELAAEAGSASLVPADRFGEFL